MNARKFCRAALLTSTLSLVGLPVLSAAQEAHPPHWAYEGKEGPKEWGNLDSSYAACAVGKTQSPIDIKGCNREYHASRGLRQENKPFIRRHPTLDLLRNLNNTAPQSE
jgi:carbonic anhydrase